MGEYFHLLVGQIAALRELRDETGEPSRLFMPRAGGTVAAAPITIQMSENIPAWYGPIGRGAERALPPTDVTFGERMSASGALAYVESESHAEIGYRAAALWQDGALVFGFELERDEVAPSVPPPRGGIGRWFGRTPPAPPPVPRDPNPLDRAIAAVIGAVPEAGTFERFGFMPIRSNEDLAYHWVEVTDAG